MPNYSPKPVELQFTLEWVDTNIISLELSLMRQHRTVQSYSQNAPPACTHYFCVLLLNLNGKSVIQSVVEAVSKNISHLRSNSIPITWLRLTDTCHTKRQEFQRFIWFVNERIDFVLFCPTPQSSQQFMRRYRCNIIRLICTCDKLQPAIQHLDHSPHTLRVWLLRDEHRKAN